MTISEFSNEFDVLYNNIMSNQAPGLDEYEKSVFLTKAQDEIVKSYFNPALNKSQQGFDGNERRQIDFSMLMRTAIGTSVTPSVNIHTGSNTRYYAMPTDILLYINEFITATRGTNTVQLTVVPLSYNEYNRLMSKPFKRPLKNQAWRLITSGSANSYTYTDYSAIASALVELDTVTADAKTVFNTINGKELSISDNQLKVGDRAVGDDGKLTATGVNVSTIASTLTEYISSTVASSSTVVEIIPGPNDTISSYIVRYVARPKPIVLTDLSSEGVSLGGNTTTAQGCELDPILHEEILQRAVELAKAAYTGDLQSQITLGQTSETNMGAVAQQR